MLKTSTVGSEDLETDAEETPCLSHEPPESCGQGRSAAHGSCKWAGMRGQE